MRLVAIGEGFKNIDKITGNQLLLNYSDMPWKQNKGARDILSHHYFDLDAEVIFTICKNEITTLLKTTTLIINDIKS